MMRFLHNKPFWFTLACAAAFAASAQSPPLHTFYLDMDRDSFGDPTYPIEIYLPYPPTGLLVPNRNDPDDNDPLALPPAVPKGDRLLALDLFEGSEQGAWRATLDLAREIGADAMTMELFWNEFESAPGVFEGSQGQVVEVLGQTLPPDGLMLSLTVSPISAGMLTLPTDLLAGIYDGSLTFSDAGVIDRFNALLDFLHRQLDGVTLVSLQIGNEVDRLYADVPYPQFWEGYYSFCASVAQYAKALWGSDLKVGVTSTHTGLTDPVTGPLMSALNTVSDIVSVTYFPRNPDFTVSAATGISGDLAALAAAGGNKPIHIQATGFPSSPVANSSPTKQSQYLHALFDAWDRHATSIPFLGFQSLHDMTPARALGLAQSYRLDLETEAVARAHLASQGLRTRNAEGTHKPGYKTLRNQAFERGWWRAKARQSRPYLLGWMRTGYDYPQTPEETRAMWRWVDNRIAADGETMGIHIDAKVPWVEAYNDTFESPELPYVKSLKTSWADLKAARPPGHKLVLTMTPLGVPRSRKAFYWGYGEEFEYQQEAPFDVIPTGVFSEGDQRLPPEPWRSYTLADEPVKIAYLNFAKRALQFFEPDYLGIGIEVDGAQVASQLHWDRYLELHKFVYQRLKAEYPEVPIMVTFSATSYMTDELFSEVADRSAETGVTYKWEEMPAGVREALVQGFRDILPYTDIIGLSLYPHFGKYNAYQTPASMYDELFQMFTDLGAGDKPIAVEEHGYSADPYDILDLMYFTGSAEKQDRFYKLLFYELDKSSHPVEFVQGWSVRDMDLGHQRLVDENGEDDLFTEFYKYFRDIGLYDGDGNPRAATQTWLDELALPHVPR